MLRPLTRNNWCYRFLYFGMANAVTIAALAVSPSRADAQQQQKEQSTPEPQQQTPQSKPGTTAAPQPSSAVSPVSQAHLPQIVVSAPKGRPKPQSTPRPVASGLPLVTPENPVAAAQHALDATMNSLDQARDNNLLPKIGASTRSEERRVGKEC